MTAGSAGETAFQHQEVSFSVCMAALAVLARDNPDYSPHLLWAFAALLAFNLVYHVLLRTRGETWYVPMISMAANTVLVTAVLALSGGADSPFWPMYLLPIFTACLYLSRRHVVFAAASAAAFLACLYVPTEGPLSQPLWVFVEFAIKAAVLAVSASVTAQYSLRERRARRELGESHAKLESLAAALERAQRERLESGGGMARFLAGLIYDLNGRLALIRGRAEILENVLGEESAQTADARAIAETARALSRLGSDLLRALKRPEEESGPVEVAPLLQQVLDIVEHRLRPHALALKSAIAPDLPAVRVGAPHLQQALLELFEAAIDQARPNSELTVSAERREGEVRLRLRFEAGEEDAPKAPVSPRRLLESFDAGAEALGLGRSCEYSVRLPLAAGVSKH